MSYIHRTHATLGLAAVTAVAMTGCSGTASGSSTPATSSATATSAMSSSPASSAMSASPTVNPAAGLVGPGRADYARANPSGPGSVQGRSADPGAVAASNNPLPTTPVKAV